MKSNTGSQKQLCLFSSFLLLYLYRNLCLVIALNTFPAPSETNAWYSTSAIVHRQHERKIKETNKNKQNKT